MIRKDRSDYPEINENGERTSGTTIKVEKTVKSLLKNFCEINQISCYRMLNLLITNFISQASSAEDGELFLAQYFKSEKDFVKILRTNQDKKIVRFRSLNPKREKSIKIKVPHEIWTDFCKNAFHRRKKQEKDLVEAIMSHVNKTCTERNYKD